MVNIIGFQIDKLIDSTEIYRCDITKDLEERLNGMVYILAKPRGNNFQIFDNETCVGDLKIYTNIIIKINLYGKSLKDLEGILNMKYRNKEVKIFIPLTEYNICSRELAKKFVKYHGTVRATSLREACQILCSKSSDFEDYYNKENMTWKNLRVFNGDRPDIDRMKLFE